MFDRSNLLTSSLCLSLCACGTFQAQSRTDPIRVASYTSAVGKCVEPQFPGDRHVGTINLDCFTFSGDTDYAYKLAAKNAGYRNRLASFLMNESNTVCTREMGNLTANEAMVNAGLAMATTAFSTVGSLVTGQVASNVLSGLASGTNATRGHINAEVYRSVLSTAVSKAIQNERDDQRAAILTHFSDGIAAYPVDLMLMDVNNYHQTCSFYRGLGLVIDAVSRPTDGESDQRLRAQAAVAQRQLQVASLERQLAQVPAGEQHDAKREALRQKLQAAQDKYDAAIDTLTAVGTTAPPVAPPQEAGEAVENATTNGQ
jgi:hypothetical protein